MGRPAQVQVLPITNSTAVIVAERLRRETRKSQRFCTPGCCACGSSHSTMVARIAPSALHGLHPLIEIHAFSTQKGQAG